MKLGEIFQSVEAWKKLTSVNIQPKLAYTVLKYTRLVEEEYKIVEQQRRGLFREIAGTEEGEDAQLEAETPELMEFVARFGEILSQESSLEKIDLEFETVVDALDDKDAVISVSDLAALEPFFKIEINNTPKEKHDEKDVAK